MSLGKMFSFKWKQLYKCKASEMQSHKLWPTTSYHTTDLIVKQGTPLNSEHDKSAGGDVAKYYISFLILKHIIKRPQFLLL